MEIIENKSYTNNVIILNSAERKIQRCEHKRMTVDEKLAQVECDDCGEKLNAISVLLRFSREETRWKQEGEKLIKLREELEKRTRCKCQHCGNMTRIKV